MPSTNMDINKNKDVTVPVFEFMLPKSEVQADLTVGEYGEISIPVQIIAVDKDSVTFRKNGPAIAEDMFKPEPLHQMRDRMGVTDEPEKSMSKNLKKEEEK
jgi:hypothetical protein